MNTAEEIKKRVHKAARRALEEVADDLLARAKNDVSVQSTNLRDSGRTTKVRRRKNTFTVKVIFGNEKVPYAAAQEFGKMSYTRESAPGLPGKYSTLEGGRIFWEVKNHPGGGKTHYLGDNLKAMVPTYREHMKKAVREELFRAHHE